MHLNWKNHVLFFYNSNLHTYKIEMIDFSCILLHFFVVGEKIVFTKIFYFSKVQTHNQLLKDLMRERCVTQMVDSWFSILCNYKQSECVGTCLQVVGAYINWIDINLIANHRYILLCDSLQISF